MRVEKIRDLTLGELIERLEMEDSNTRINIGLGNPHSYRGIFEDLAFELVEDVTIGEMLQSARSAINNTYTGWHGGDYTMTEETWVHLAEFGESGTPISNILIELLLNSKDAMEKMEKITNEKREEEKKIQTKGEREKN